MPVNLSPLNSIPIVQEVREDEQANVSDDSSDNILSARKRPKKKASLDDYDLPQVSLGEGAYG